MQNKKKLLKQGVSIFMAATLVFVSVPDVQAMAKKGKQAKKICLTSPASETGKKVKTSLYLKKGERFKIKSKVTPAQARKKLIYKSSKKKIATVSKRGQIKAKNYGKAKITVKAKNSKVSAIIQVTVVKKIKKVKKISLDTTALSLAVGSTKQLTAKIVSPKKPTTKKFNWYSSNKKVASVNKKGVVTAKKAGSAKITVTSADGRGAKAVCRVTVWSDNKDKTTDSSGKNTTPIPKVSPTPTASQSVSNKPVQTTTLTPSAETGEPNITVPGNRTGIKQGESLQLTAGNVAVNWSVSEEAGVSISDSGLLTIAKDAATGNEIIVTAVSKANSALKDTVSLTIIEDSSTIPETQLQLNQDSAEQPYGLTYRTGSNGKKAFSTVTDPERGEVIRFDANVGYTSTSYDVLAWMEVDPAYAGKTVSISAWLKYEKSDSIDKKMNLVINERWKNSNPAVKWNAEPDTWYHLTGTYTFPDPILTNEGRNRLYICRDTSLPSGVNAVYYIDDLVFSVEKSEVEKVTLSTKDDATEIYQNHTLQCTAEVTGTNSPMQKVTYSIEPKVEGASIDENGLLTVGNAAAGAKINIKAVSFEDPTKSATKTVTVLAQKIDSISIAAKDSPKTIYQGNSLQFTSEVTATGEPDTAVTWSVSPTVSGVTISKDGLLTVADNVADNTAITIKATSVFDKSKSATYPITVHANKINSVTVKSAGDKTTIDSELPLNLSAVVDITGTPSTAVTWSIPTPVAGASLASATGSNNTLSVTKDVTDGTSIIVRATSDFDKTKYGEITVTVSNASSDEFNINKLNVEYFENFDGTAPEGSSLIDTVKEAGVFSWKATDPTDESFCPGLTDESFSNIYQNLGIHKTDEGLSLYQRRTKGFKSFLGNKEDYLQFTLTNTENMEKTYTLSLFFRFMDINADSQYIKSQMQTDASFVRYQLPLKLVAVDENGTTTTIKDNIKIPFRCSYSTSTNPELYDITGVVKIPAMKTVNVRLMLNGDLPTCLSPDHTAENADFANTPHPCTYMIDNIAVSSGNIPTVSLKVGDTHQLNLDKVDTDTVKYYTNSYLAQYTHGTSDTCTRFATTVADVDDTGKITANKAGETALIAEITHADGTVERKQCIVKVTE